MPVTPTYPGVYIQEIASGVRTLVGVGTSITAFVGVAARGPVNEPVSIFSFGDYERIFGGLNYNSTMSYAVNHYFLNGGSQAIIVRVAAAASAKGGHALTVTGPPTGTLNLVATSEGSWYDNIYVSVDYNTTNSADDTLFNITLRERSGGVSGTIVSEEVFRNVSSTASNPRFITNVLENESSIARVNGAVPVKRPDATGGTDAASNGSGDDGDWGATVVGSGYETNKKGIYALEKADLFNILCIPPRGRAADQPLATWTEATVYAKKRRAMIIIDPPAAWDGADDVYDTTNGVDGSSGTAFKVRDKNAILYFPRVLANDPLQGNVLNQFAACGAVAGVIARTDSERGIWKAPAGLDARLVGIAGPTVKLTDGESGLINPLGVNAIRSMPAAGNVIWGARTMDGADRLASEWKYVPVRRVALYIEESLYRGTQWVVFEPNDEPLWGQIRLNVGAFMHQLFTKGAFQGAKPSEAYFVKCDKETTTQNDINQGVVNIVVGFAPLKPAEFVIIKLQQIAGQIQS